MCGGVSVGWFVLRDSAFHCESEYGQYVVYIHVAVLVAVHVVGVHTRNTSGRVDVKIHVMYTSKLHTRCFAVSKRRVLMDFVLHEYFVIFKNLNFMYF